MNEPYISSIYKKPIKDGKDFSSILLRLSLLTFSFVIYFLFISPTFEHIFSSFMIKGVRETRKYTLNYLTPLYGQELYTNEYALSTLANSDKLNNVTSNTTFKTEDPRVIGIQKFLLDYNSPMYPSSRTFLTEADKYGLDWRLVVAISGVESAFGRIIPRGTHNAWGWRGINKNPQGWSIFDSWDNGIAEVTRGLSQGYGIHLNPFQIEPYYCPPCGLNPAHAWANGVSRYMRELKYYVDNLK